MSKSLPELSKEQWAFLAVLWTLEGSASIETIGTIVPLMPDDLFDMFEKAEKSGWIKQIKKNRISLAENLPKAVLTKIRKITNSKWQSSIIDRIYSRELSEQIEKDLMVDLLEKAGRITESSKLLIELAHFAFQDNRHERARQHFNRAVYNLFGSNLDSDSGPIFISGTLQLSNLCFYLGQGLADIQKYLDKAYETARKLGDKRSTALVNLHLGRLFYFSDRRDDALIALSMGREEIEALGDEDILSQSNTFLGIFYFSQGLFKNAIKYFEKAEQYIGASKKGILVNPTAPLFHGLCAAYLGQFHRSIGSLDFQWRKAVEQKDNEIASIIRAVLGAVLILMQKNHKASIHLYEARDDALKSNNDFGLYLARGGISLYHFNEGRVEKAYHALKETFVEGSRAGLIRQYASPWYLEMLHEFECLGFDPIPGFNFPETINTVINSININLKGVALRLRAKGKINNGGNKNEIIKDLDSSEDYLIRSGDTVQLAKTILEKTRLEMNAGNREKARNLALKAKRILGSYFETFFPDEFRPLVEEKNFMSKKEIAQNDFLKRYFNTIETLHHIEDQQEIVNSSIGAINRVFGFERGGLFWFSEGKTLNIPELMAAYNLTDKHVLSEDFQDSRKIILKSFQEKKLLLIRPGLKDSLPNTRAIKTILCYPVEIKNQIQGVLYLDNSYLEETFNFIDESLMSQIIRHTIANIYRSFDYVLIKNQQDALISEKQQKMEQFGNQQLIARSTVMKKIIAQADRVSDSDSTVLILGETGTGKELLAKRIQYMSKRRDKPFIIVDATTIPENLTESELFGHEKGAFTGADSRRIGRIEQAHSGTLFFDEIGEIPLNLQVKLLRVLQEKTFNRIGGTRPITSNFRLIAATNRDLSKEVEEGRFRKDLFYRLNVIPINLPPLKDRGVDIIILTQYFMERYGKKYARTGLSLSPDDKNKLSIYTWPGNIRELENIIERAVILSTGSQIEINLPITVESSLPHSLDDKPTLDELQRRYIKRILQFTNGKISGPDGAAEILGMKRTSLYSRMKTLGLDINEKP